MEGIHEFVNKIKETIENRVRNGLRPTRIIITKEAYNSLCTTCLKLSGAKWDGFIFGVRVETCDAKDKYDFAVNGHPNKVRCLETGVVYRDTKHASQSTGIDSLDIYKCARFEIENAGGYHWRWILGEIDG